MKNCTLKSKKARIYDCFNRQKRYCLPNSEVMIHQPLGGAQGQATDIEIQAAEIIRIKKTLNEILASNTGQSLKKIEKDTDRDYIMTPTEAMEYGMIDKVISIEQTKNN